MSNHIDPASFAVGLGLGLMLGAWIHDTLKAPGRRMVRPRGSYSLPPHHDWRRGFNHENTNRPAGEPPLKLRRSTDREPRFTEGRTIRGNGNGGPSTAKPPIKPQPQGGRMVGDDLCPPPPPIKPQFPPPRIIREDFLS